MKMIPVLTVCMFALVLATAVYRDIQADKHNPADLRNRVVGARLIKDGKSPYFYKWKAADGIRYYDPVAFDSLTFSNMTATPFFHHLIAPLAELPQRQLSKQWLLIQYLLLLTALVFFLRAAPDTMRQILLVAAAALFLLTEGWKMSIQNGQNYLFIPFFAMLFYFAFIQKKTPVWALVAGSLAVSLVLIRPNCIFFFVPFVLLLKKLPRNYLLALFTPLLFFALWLAFSKQERFFWDDYRRQVTLQIKMHQGIPATLQQNEKGYYANWEGIDSKVLARDIREHPYLQHTENGNFFVLYYKIAKSKLSLTTISILSAFTLLVLSGYFYYKHWKYDPGPEALALMGYCLYMVSDFYSPVYRHQYYTVQWMFPIFLALIAFRPSFRWTYMFIWTGLVLNCLNISYIKMEHTIGEYMLLLAIGVLAFSKAKEQPGTERQYE